jgi:hypothetical protein
MHAVVIRVTVSDMGAVLEALPERVVPLVFQNPGFVTGYWTVKDMTGLCFVVFDSEDAANFARDKVSAAGQYLPPVVTLDDVEVREVVQHA